MLPARCNLALIVLTLLVPCSHVLSQPALLQGRLEPYGSNANTAQLPLTLSWPLSQVTVTFQDSTLVTVVLANVSYASPFSFEESLITQYVTFKSSAAVSQDVSVVAGEARITLSGLPERGQHTAILTKLDEGNRGKGACLLPLIRAQPSLCKLTSFAPVGSLAVLGFELDAGGR